MTDLGKKQLEEVLSSFEVKAKLLLIGLEAQIGGFPVSPPHQKLPIDFCTFGSACCVFDAVLLLRQPGSLFVSASLAASSHWWLIKLWRISHTDFCCALSFPSPVCVWLKFGAQLHSLRYLYEVLNPAHCHGFSGFHLWILVLSFEITHFIVSCVFVFCGFFLLV